MSRHHHRFGSSGTVHSPSTRASARLHGAGRIAYACARQAGARVADARRLRRHAAAHGARPCCALARDIQPLGRHAASRPTARVDRARGARIRQGPRRRVLEATFDAGCRLGDWDFQMLGIAAHLGALVLEIERNASAARSRRSAQRRAVSSRDGAAPLIGSTPAMQLLRSRDRARRAPPTSPCCSKARAASARSWSRGRSTI